MEGRGRVGHLPEVPRDSGPQRLELFRGGGREADVVPDVRRIVQGQ